MRVMTNFNYYSSGRMPLYLRSCRKIKFMLKKTIALLHMFKPKHFNLGHTA